MEKGIKSRRKILETAVKLFARYSYPDVSYSLLEEATGISRGSMVYYFKNKDGIFRAVIDDFLLKAVNPNDIPDDMRGSLKDFIDAFVALLKDFYSRFKPYRIKNLNAARFNIERSASQFIPDFNESMANNRAESTRVWKGVIENAVSSGEIRPVDSDLMALTFLDSYLGFIYADAFAKEQSSPDALARIFDNLYSLIKN